METKQVLENKETLIKEYNSLRGYEEKINFWESVLHRDYIEFFINELDNKNAIVLDEFEIIPEEDEWLSFNQYIIESYNSHNLSQKKLNPTTPNSNRLLGKADWRFYDFEALKKRILLKIEKGAEQETIIIDEIKYIDEARKGGKELHSSLFKLRFNADKETFEDYLKYKKVPNFSKIRPSVYYTSTVHNGYNLAKYYHFLEGELSKITDTKKQQETDNNNKFTIEQQFLVLDYLGVLAKLDNIKIDTKKAEFIALLIRRDVQSVRQILVNKQILKSSNIKSEKNKIKQKLVKISAIFENLGLKTTQKKVLGDIKKLDQ